MMNILKRYELLLVVGLAWVVVWFLNKTAMMPALFAGGYFLIGMNYFFESQKIKSSGSLLVPPHRGRIKVWVIRMALVFQGVILLTSGVTEIAPFLQYKGIDVKVFAGVLLMMAGLLRNKRYLFLITPVTITFNDQNGWAEWKIDEISSFSARRNKMIFRKGDSSREIILPDTGKDYPSLISKRLKQLWHQ
jgi:hypothetical protein